ncbi:MAG: methyltransferase domain-containing protein [Luteitalea sp.]|nr:methyltransferase domain-containing protein [Luteitalea sp.]
MQFVNVLSSSPQKIARLGWKLITERSLQRTGDRILGALELPRPMQAYSHWLNIRGWACARDGQPVTVVVKAGGRTLAELHPSTPRPDVARVHPGVPGSDRSGFESIVPASALPRRRMAVVRVEAQIGNASVSVTRTLSVVPVLRFSGRSFGLPRFAYEKVWDRSSATLADARISVAGYDDDAEWKRSGASTANHVAEKTQISPSDIVLEVGCGAGRVGTQLAHRCSRWIGADVSSNMLKFAEVALRESGQANVSFVHLNGVDLTGVAHTTIDVVYCTTVFMHLDEWERFRYVADSFRVLRPGGRIYFDNFDLGSEMGWALFEETSRLDAAARPPNVSKSSTGEELRVYAEKAGFVNIEIERGALFVTIVAEKPR